MERRFVLDYLYLPLQDIEKHKASGMVRSGGGPGRAVSEGSLGSNPKAFFAPGDVGQGRMSQRPTGLLKQMDTHAQSSSIYRFGPYHVDVPAAQLRKHGSKIKLAGQPFDILVMLLERAGQVVTREEIQQRLWSGETFVDFE